MKNNIKLIFKSGEYKGANIPIPMSGEFVMGRDSQVCQLVFSDKHISRKQCAVYYDRYNDKVMLRNDSQSLSIKVEHYKKVSGDLGSIETRELKVPGECMCLESGDRIYIGRSSEVFTVLYEEVQTDSHDHVHVQPKKQSDDSKSSNTPGGSGMNTGLVMGIIAGVCVLLVCVIVAIVFKEYESKPSRYYATLTAETTAVPTTELSTEPTTEPTTEPSTEPTTEPTTESTPDSLTVAEVSEIVTPSVVLVEGLSDDEAYISSGSGVVVKKDSTYLYIVTNYHVIDGCGALAVGFVNDKGKFVDDSAAIVEIKGYREENDIAVLTVRIADLPDDIRDSVKAVQMGSSGSLKLGDQTVVIGNANGDGMSVTVGIVSALDKQCMMEDGKILNLIQTDAAVNPGNSGGALANMKGELVGIVQSKKEEVSLEGMGYAIPISDVRSIIDSIIAGD